VRRGKRRANAAQQHRQPASANFASGLFAARRSTISGIPTNQSKRETKTAGQNAIDFEKAGGLVAGIVQDAETGEVLMLGFLNEESYRRTQETGFVTFWSRTRSKLWMKGETSGNRLRVVTAATDCDNDALLFRVVVEGDGLVCHEGTVSCFTKPIAVGAEEKL
jgi:phosphoribosyl-AMP cyclohydrolase